MNIIQNKIQDLYKSLFATTPSSKYIKYISIAFTGISLCSLRYLFWRIFNKIHKYPPGPLGIPFLGCFLPFATNPRKFLVNIRNKYGPITYVPLIASNNIYISNPKILRQLYQIEKINDRPPITSRRSPPLSEISGNIWSKRRKYTSTTVFNLTNTSFILSHIKKALKNIEPEMNQKHIKNGRGDIARQKWYPSKHLYYIALNNVFCAVVGDILS